MELFLHPRPEVESSSLCSESVGATRFYASTQVRDLANIAEITTLCREIATCVGSSAHRTPRGMIQKIADEAARGSRHWELVHQTLVGQRQGSSPFSSD